MHLDMNKKPLISVIMNCYNGESFLKEAIESLLQQTYANWELVFWDNASTDQSKNILLSYSDKRIKYFCATSHTGLGTARVEALKKAQGIYITILDADDIWLKDKLSFQVDKMLSFSSSSKEVGLIYGRCELFFEGSIPKETKTLPLEGEIFDQLLSGKTSIPLPTLFFPKNVYDKVGGFNASYDYCNDLDLLLKISSKYDAFFIDEVIAKYRMHNKSLTGLSNQSSGKHYIEYIRLISQYLPNPKAAKRFSDLLNGYAFFLIKKRKFTELMAILPIVRKSALLFYPVKVIFRRFFT